MKEKHREKGYICIINITVTNIIFLTAAEDLFQGHQSGEKQKKPPTINSVNGILSETQRDIQQYLLPFLGLVMTRRQHMRDAGKR